CRAANLFYYILCNGQRFKNLFKVNLGEISEIHIVKQQEKKMFPASKKESSRGIEEIILARGLCCGRKTD
ncbi:hypothetical protein, partial [Faecalispora jeddahensis]|uniref:hypothetical protein n=1 Tax=Faecalispora jeddahensis TaxID=1414721 RepID=UPI001A987ACE